MIAAKAVRLGWHRTSQVAKRAQAVSVAAIDEPVQTVPLDAIEWPERHGIHGPAPSSE